MAAYPTLHALYDLSFLAYLLAYAVGSSRYSSPLLHLAGLVLVRPSSASAPPPSTVFPFSVTAALCG